MKGFIFFITLFFVSFSVNAQNWLWARATTGTAGGIGLGLEEPYSVCVDAAGNMLVTGWFANDTITFGSIKLGHTVGGANVFIAKYNPNGNVLWAKCSKSRQIYNEGHSVCTDLNGNVILAGIFEDTITFGSTTLTNTGCQSIFLIKYDASGNILWTQKTNSPSTSYGVSTDSNGNIFLTGSFAGTSITFGSTTLTNTGNASVFLVKYDPNGNVLWAKGSSCGGTAEALSVSVDPSGNGFITGYFSDITISFNTATITNAGGYYGSDMFIAKYDANGNVLWAKDAGGTDNEEGYSISADVNGNSFVTGFFKSTACSFGSFTLSNPNNYSDVFIAKYDANGNVLWVKQGDGAGTNEGFSVSADPNGNVFLAGGFSNAVAPPGPQYPITFGSTTINPPANAFDPMFIIKYDGNGNLLCSTALASGGDDYDGVAADAFGNAYIAGDFVFDPFMIGSDTLYRAATENFFAAKYTCCPVTIPNVTINGNLNICSGQSTTLNTSGGVIYSWNTGATSNVISVSPTITTNYSVIVTSANGCIAKGSVTANVTPYPTVIISSISTICIGTTITLTASGGSNYLWNTGAVTSAIQVNPTSATSYTVTVTSGNNCSSTTSTTVNINPLPIPSIIGGNDICPGTITTLLASGGVSYSWNTGAATQIISVSPTITSAYTVTVTDNNGCKADTNYTITVLPNPIATTSGNVTIFPTQSTTLTANGGINYLWNTSETTSTISVAPTITTIYCVTVTDANNCIDSACARVYVESPCDTAGTFFFPNAFSPNNDGDNDALKIYYNEMNCIATLHLIIYDRWGEQVFETTDKNFSWDGTYPNKILNTQVLAYNLTVGFTDSKTINRKGNISLVR